MENINKFMAMGFVFIIEDLKEEGRILELMISGEEILDKELSIYGKYPQYVVQFDKMFKDINSDNDGSVCFNYSHRKINKLFEDKEFKNIFFRKNATKEWSDEILKTVQIIKFSDKIYTIEKVDKLLAFTLEYYPKDDKNIYFKTEFHFSNRSSVTLTLTYKDRNIGVTLADKYPQYKIIIQDFLETSLSSSFGEDILGKPYFTKKASDLNNDGENVEKSGISSNIIINSDFYAVRKYDGLVFDVMYLTKGELDKGLTFEEKYSKNIYDWFPR